MDKRAIASKNKKILSHLNKKYELSFELISDKYSNSLLGILGQKSVWIFIYDGAVVIEASNFLKGSRYQRNQITKDYEVDQEKIKEIEQEFEKKIEGLRVEEKKEKIKKMFIDNKETGRNMVNANMIKALYYMDELSGKQVDSFASPEKIIRELNKYMEGTNYNREERFIPLLQGVERHKKYKINDNDLRRDVLRTASGKIVDFQNGGVKVYESHKDFIEKNKKQRV